MPIKSEDKHRYPRDWPAISLAVREAAGFRCEWCGIARGAPSPISGYPVRITVAHLDHQPENNERGNLAALCERCHLGYDAKHHAATRAARLRAKRALGDLLQQEDRP